MCTGNLVPPCMSAESLQELVHAYLPIARAEVADAAVALVARSRVQVRPLEDGMSRWLGVTDGTSRFRSRRPTGIGHPRPILPLSNAVRLFLRLSESLGKFQDRLALTN